MILSSISKYAKIWLLLTFTIVTNAVGNARNLPSEGEEGLSASKVFAEIPLDVLDMLRPSTRLDMLDYYSQADSILIVKDALGGQSRLVKVTPDYLKAEVTPVSTLEIKILPAKKAPVIMTLYTVGSDSIPRDTQVRFFDASMQPLLSEKLLISPHLKSFFHLKDSGISESELKEKIPFESICYSTGPGNVPLKASFTALATLSKEDREMLMPLLIPSLTADWNSKFKFK